MVEAIVDASRVVGAENGTYDLVVMDLELPHVSGTDVLRSLRSSSKVPIIVVTALDAEADKVQHQTEDRARFLAPGSPRDDPR